MRLSFHAPRKTLVLLELDRDGEITPALSVVGVVGAALPPLADEQRVPIDEARRPRDEVLDVRGVVGVVLPVELQVVVLPDRGVRPAADPAAVLDVVDRERVVVEPLGVVPRGPVGEAQDDEAVDATVELDAELQVVAALVGVRHIAGAVVLGVAPAVVVVGLVRGVVDGVVVAVLDLVVLAVGLVARPHVAAADEESEGEEGSDRGTHVYLLADGSLPNRTNHYTPNGQKCQ